MFHHRSTELHYWNGSTEAPTRAKSQKPKAKNRELFHASSCCLFVLSTICFVAGRFGGIMGGSRLSWLWGLFLFLPGFVLALSGNIPSACDIVESRMRFPLDSVNF